MNTDTQLIIRSMQPEDADGVLAVYAEGIATGIATFETTVPAYTAWDSAHLASPRLVAEQGDTVIGWAALTPVSGRCVYAGVAEVSVYVSKEGRGKGAGTLLLNELCRLSEEQDLWTLQAGIFEENIASLNIHAKAGFRVVGVRERLGKLNGSWKNVVLLERRSTTIGVE